MIEILSLCRNILSSAVTTVSDSFLVPYKDIFRVLFHGFILSNIIAGFWLLDSLKDPILSTIVGIEYQPIAKFFSVLTTLFVVCIYDFLTSIVSKPTLFHIVSFFYGSLTFIITGLLSHPEIGLSNVSEKGSHRWLGWLSYFTIESYGSLMVALFWSFTNSIMDLEQAKGSYGLIISIAQVGAILGSTLATSSNKVGVPVLYLLGSLSIFWISILIKIYYIVFNDKKTERVKSPIRERLVEGIREKNHNSLLFRQNNNNDDDDDNSDYSDNNNNDNDYCDTSNNKNNNNNSYNFDNNDHNNMTVYLNIFQNMFKSFYEGLLLIFKHDYILKLAGISCLYEIILTVLDYQFKILGNDHTAFSTIITNNSTISSYSSNNLNNNININSNSNNFNSIDKDIIGNEDRFANLLGHFGQFTNIISFFISFFGFSYIINKIDVKKSLIIFPLILFFSVIITNLVPSLWILFFFVSVIKAISFSLNEPIKELLYIPTSQSIKFKAKAWIDVFGSRLAKGLGSYLTHSSHGDIKKLRRISEIPCIIISVIILTLAWQIGTEFQNLIENNTIIGDENNGNNRNNKNNTNNNALQNSQQNEKKGHDGHNGAVLKARKGIFPGDVGYDEYNDSLFEGVFDSSGNSGGSSSNSDGGDSGSGDSGGGNSSGNDFKNNGGDGDSNDNTNSSSVGSNSNAHKMDHNKNNNDNNNNDKTNDNPQVSVKIKESHNNWRDKKGMQMDIL